ncbi:MAG: hypothetical protein WAL22_22845 [Solirubrobacteraceae bacterium]
MQSKLLPLLQPDHQTRSHRPLSEQVIFQSPVKDYRGPADVAHIVATIGEVLDRIDPRRELAADHEVVTILTAVHGGEPMDGVLYETHDAAGRVDHATLLLRPLATLRHAIDGMVAALEQSPLPSKLG